MKRLYTHFKCTHAEDIPVEEFTEEIQAIIKRAF